MLAVALTLGVAGCGGDSDSDGGTTETDHRIDQKDDWAYSGAKGPSHWAAMKAKYPECGRGRHQSPIDVRSVTAGPFAPVSFSYRPERLTLEANGHAVEADLEDSKSSIGIGGKSYALKQFHFHSPAEERLDGRRFPLGMHLVHESDSGELAVIAVHFHQGTANPAFEPLVRNLPARTGEQREVPGAHDPGALLPSGGRVFRYTGSLTTPPCSEGVRWTLYERPVTLSPEQIEAIADVYPGSARPVQPLNGRTVLVGPATRP